MFYLFKARKLLFGLILAAFVNQPIASGNENNFQPHRAYYKMSLGTSKSTSGIVGVDGRMVFEWRSVCDGWVVEQRYLMRYQKEQGAESVTDTEYSTWESKDGKQYKFYVTNKLSEGIDDIEGLAIRSTEKKMGTVYFQMPKKIEYQLPVKSIFPSRHTFSLLEAAKAQKIFLVIPVFDGSELKNAVSVSSVIGRQKVLKEPKNTLLTAKYWPIRMAFFSSESDEAGPSHEMTINLHENGITSGLTLDYFDFTINMELVRIEKIAHPSC